MTHSVRSLSIKTIYLDGNIMFDMMLPSEFIHIGQTFNINIFDSEILDVKIKLVKVKSIKNSVLHLESI